MLSKMPSFQQEYKHAKKRCELCKTVQQKADQGRRHLGGGSGRSRGSYGPSLHPESSRKPRLEDWQGHLGQLGLSWGRNSRFTFSQPWRP